MTTLAPSTKSRSVINKQQWQIGLLIGKAKSNWSLHKRKTYGDMLESFGHDRRDLNYVFSKDQLYSIIDSKRIDAERDTLLCRLAMKDYPSMSGDNKPCYDYPPEFSTDKPTTELVVYEPEVKPIDVEIVEPPKYSPHFKLQCPGQTATLHPKQAEAGSKIVDSFHNGSYARLLIGGTGVGKTYVAGAVIANLHANGFFHGKCQGPTPILYITKASIVEQTKEVLVNEFGLSASRDFHILNVEQLRASLGGMYLKETVIIENGEAHVEWQWRKIMHPCIFIWDECQILKNEQSEQAKIGQASTKIDHPHVYHMFMSATPYFRVCEARVFVCACKKKSDLGGVYRTIKEENWASYAKLIASPAEPEEYSEAAVKRLTDDMSEHIIRMKNVRPKFHARNGVMRIQFATEEERRRYDTAYSRFQAKKTKIEGLEYLSRSQSHLAILAQMNKFAEEAELIRGPWLANQCVDAWSRGKSPGLILRFKGTINSVVWELIHKHGWNRSDISLVWGGNVKAKKDKKKEAARNMMENDLLMEELKKAGIDLGDLGMDYSEADLAFKTPEQLAFEKEYDLGMQNPAKRHREVTRYMHQKSRVAIITYKSGGVGLSLHHKYEYAYPREVYLTPVYSGVELVQGYGRFPRLTSLSDTEQYMVFYGGTIEDDVMARVKQKLGCLSQVIRQRESWQDIIIKSNKGPVVDDTKLLDAPDDEDDEDDEDDGGIYIEEDDES